MRVVYVSTDPGVPTFGRKGSSVHVQSILTQMLLRGDEVHLVTTRTGGHPPAGLEGVTVHLLPRAHGGDPAEREAAIRAADAEVPPILDALHAEAPVDLVYERYALWGRSATAWARDHGVRSVLEVNSPLPEEQARHRHLVDRAGADAVARAATAAAEVVVCVSDPVADWVRGLGSAEPPAVRTIPNGVDTRRIRPVPLRRDPATFTVGFVGTLKPWHGVDDLVHAVHLLHRDDPSYRLLLVGDGPERDRLLGLATSMGLADAIEMTGPVDPADIPTHLARMDVGVAPYPRLEDFYFSPLKVYEYLSAGLPVITSDAGDLPELLGGAPEGELGVLYRAGSAEELASAIARLRHAPATRATLAARARAAMVARHDWGRVLDRILAPGGDHGAQQAS